MYTIWKNNAFLFLRPPRNPSFQADAAVEAGGLGGDEYDYDYYLTLCEITGDCDEEEDPRDKCKTKNGQTCVFPFSYKGKRYR